MQERTEILLDAAGRAHERAKRAARLLVAAAIEMDALESAAGAPVPEDHVARIVEDAVSQASTTAGQA